MSMRHRALEILEVFVLGLFFISTAVITAVCALSLREVMSSFF